jgi:hypothetical protein
MRDRRSPFRMVFAFLPLSTNFPAALRTGRVIAPFDATNRSEDEDRENCLAGFVRIVLSSARRLRLLGSKSCHTVHDGNGDFNLLEWSSHCHCENGEWRQDFARGYRRQHSEYHQNAGRANHGGADHGGARELLPGPRQYATMRIRRIRGGMDNGRKIGLYRYLELTGRN